MFQVQMSHTWLFFIQSSNFEYTTHISYLEIYNDAGYDLLDPRHEAAKLEDLPYVVHIFNISLTASLQNIYFCFCPLKCKSIAQTGSIRD